MTVKCISNKISKKSINDWIEASGWVVFIKLKFPGKLFTSVFSIIFYSFAYYKTRIINIYYLVPQT